MKMMMNNQIKPRWVLVDEALREVSEFAHLPPGERPCAICPICQCPIILKLGNDRVHHYAHRPEDICTVNETALHLNTKFYIYQQLLKARIIYTQDNCLCGAKKKDIWLEKWDDLNVEYAVELFRPDIALLSKGKVIAAIEVLVTHAVSEQKSQYFKNQKISWLEVRAEETFYKGDDAWTSEKPLPFCRRSPQVERWVCDNCKEIEARQRERTEYDKNNYEKIHAAKMVDFYFKSGKKYREVYYVMKKVKNKECIKAWIKNEKNEILALEKSPITKESMKRLNDVIKKRFVEYKDKDVIVDEIIKWQLWEHGKKFVPRDTDKYPFRYSWNVEYKKWKITDEKYI